MADVNIKYQGTSIATIDASGSKTLQTSGKYCEGDITVEYTDPEKPTQAKSATPTETAQDITPDSGKVLSKVSVGAIPKTYVGSGVTKKQRRPFRRPRASRRFAQAGSTRPARRKSRRSRRTCSRSWILILWLQISRKMWICLGWSVRSKPGAAVEKRTKSFRVIYLQQVRIQTALLLWRTIWGARRSCS